MYYDRNEFSKNLFKKLTSQQIGYCEVFILNKIHFVDLQIFNKQTKVCLP